MDTLLVGLNLLPVNELVGFVSYDTNVKIYKLSYSNYLKTIAFNGKKDYTPKIQEILKSLSSGLRTKPSMQNSYFSTVDDPARFVLPLQNAEFFLQRR